jgi:hypothetical protein
VMSAAEATFLNRVPDRWVSRAIAASAATSLALELTLRNCAKITSSTFSYRPLHLR